MTGGNAAARPIVEIRAQDVIAPLSAFSHAIQAGDFLFISGIGPLDLDRHVVGKGLEEQATATLENLRRIVAAAEASLRDIVKVTVYLGSMNHYGSFNDVYERFFINPPYPARTCLAAGGLWGGILVEIDATAYLPRGESDRR